MFPLNHGRVVRPHFLLIGGAVAVALITSGCRRSLESDQATSPEAGKTAVAESSSLSVDANGEKATDDSKEGIPSNDAMHTASEEDTSKAVPGSSSQPPAATDSSASPPNLTGASAAPNLGRTLYLRHCAGCHGADGDGQGIAAPFLFPRPRNFRDERFRLVSVTGDVPTREDLHAVLIRGMPGSSMPPWGHLSEPEREALVDEVIRLRAEGARDRYIALLKQQEGLTEEEIAEDEDLQEEIVQYVARSITPGSPLSVPTIDPPTEESIGRGKAAYFKAGCHLCHGQEGRGDGVQQMVDENGIPTLPRDFTRGIFKGNSDPASLFRRIVYGMPGTPMPALVNATEQDAIDMVHFIRSLSDEKTRQAAVLNREHIVVARVTSLPASPDDPAWQEVSPVNVRVTPLWWRNDFDPRRDAIDVRAVHDGQTIAIQLSWPDATQDTSATSSAAFEDGIALQFVRGPEPFIGMGGPASPVDTWYWDADRQVASDAPEDRYPRTVVDIYPLSEKVVSTAEYKRPGTSTENQAKESLPAVASGNLIVPDGKHAASALAAAGPGTVTFHSPSNQSVQARARWQDGRWTVVFSRALSVPPEAGVNMQPGDRVAVALAVWDGAHRDRDGQKLVSIWQEVELEQ